VRILIRAAAAGVVLGLLPLVVAGRCDGSAGPATSVTAPVGGDSLPPGVSSPQAVEPAGPSMTLPQPTMTKPPSSTPETEPEDSGAANPSTGSAP
jgi:hypothetical protein